MVPSGIPGDLPEVFSLTKYGTLLGGLYISPELVGSELIL